MNQPSNQPAPFGCRLIALAAAASLVCGLAGAWLGVRVFETKNQRSGPANQQAVTVAEDSAVIDAVKRVAPTVVSISTTTELDSFFGPIETKGGGTGFIITNDGLIATNKHVVEKAGSDLTVVTDDGKKYPAQVKALDPLLDFALIKIDGKNLPVVELGGSDTLQVGQTLIAIGNALGEFQNTVTTGVLSAKERTIQAGGGVGQADQLENLLQTDAAINPGNSGGPLINLSGQVVGVNTAVADAQGIGFAIAINQARQAIDSYNQKGKIVRASLGVRYQPLTQDYARLNNLPTDTGALLIGSRGAPAIVPGSAAARAGLQEGDILTAIDATKIDESHSLGGLIGRKSPGDEIEITFLRNGKEQKVRLKLEER